MTSATPTERDPVCGMNVNPATAKHTYELAGKKYYFCCAGCADKFKANPQGYLNKSRRTRHAGNAVGAETDASQPSKLVIPSGAFVSR